MSDELSVGGRARPDHAQAEGPRPRDLVVILGAEGLIGRALCRLLGSRHDILAVDKRPSSRPLAPRERSLQLDIGRPEAIDALFAALEPDRDRLTGVIDLVAYYDFTNEPNERYTDIESGLKILLERLGAESLPDAPFLFASSMASLEPTEPGVRQTPESPRSGKWAYPAHKVRCEEIIEAADIPQPRVELVLAGVYTEWGELVPLYQQIERVRSSPLQRHFYPGPTDRGLSYVHVDDCAAAFEAALHACRGVSGVHRYLVGETEPVTYRRIQQVAGEILLGHDVNPVRVPKLFARAGARVMSELSALKGERVFIQPWMVSFAGEHFEFDISKTVADLGWRPRHDLGRELPSMIARAREHPEEWKRRNGDRPY